MDKILNDAITIESVEQKNDRITLVDHNKNRYGFWATRKAKDEEGNPVIDQAGNQVMEDSAPMTQFKNMGLKKGMTVRIGYVIEPYTDKMGVSRESKKIINFQETNDSPSQTPPPAESSNDGANRGHSGESRDAFGRRLAIHGFVNGMLAAGATIETVVNDLPALLELEAAIDHALDNFGLVGTDRTSGDDVDVSDIPF
jgi:hypothetical protein